MDPGETQTQFQAYYVDNRRLPRADLRCPARVTTADGKKVDAMIRDITPDGLQLRCTRAAARVIRPEGGGIMPEEPPTLVEVKFRVDTVDGPSTIRLLGKLIFFARIAPNVVTIGVGIKGMSREDAARLNRFWMAALEPAEPKPDREPPRHHHQIKGAGDRLLARPRKGAPPAGGSAAGSAEDPG